MTPSADAPYKIFGARRLIVWREFGKQVPRPLCGLGMIRVWVAGRDPGRRFEAAGRMRMPWGQSASVAFMFAEPRMLAAYGGAGYIGQRGISPFSRAWTIVRGKRVDR
jgi:hypothetical protein